MCFHKLKMKIKYVLFHHCSAKITTLAASIESTFSQTLLGSVVINARGHISLESERQN